MPDLTLRDASLLLPITHYQDVPLKSEYWKSPTLHYGVDSRVMLLVSSARFYSLYKLLVTPWSVKDTPHVFAPAIPFFADSAHDAVEHFMNLSDFPVDERATHASLYTIHQPFGLKWKSQERIDATTLIESSLTH